MIKITIPVKKHVKKYLIKKYGLVHTISKKTFLGIIMLELLNEKIDSTEIRCIGFDKYEITIPELYFNTKGFSIDRNRLKFLGLCLEKLFIDDFYMFVDLELTKGNPSAWKSVSLFLKIYDINESELKLESMYRNYQRYSNEKITDKKRKLIAS